MRRLLGVLRTGEHQESGEYVPQPDVEQLDELIEQVRTAGLPVDFKVEGTPRPLPSGVELTAYRIVQEALTNTRKHGGANAGASVRLVYFDDGLGLLVEDDAPTDAGTGSSACGSASVWSAGRSTRDRAPAADSGSARCCRSSPPTDAAHVPNPTPYTYRKGPPSWRSA
jgi:hypothetical protein